MEEDKSENTRLIPSPVPCENISLISRKDLPWEEASSVNNRVGSRLLMSCDVKPECKKRSAVLCTVQVPGWLEEQRPIGTVEVGKARGEPTGATKTTSQVHLSELPTTTRY